MKMTLRFFLISSAIFGILVVSATIPHEYRSENRQIQKLLLNSRDLQLRKLRQLAPDKILDGQKPDVIFQTELSRGAIQKLVSAFQYFEWFNGTLGITKFCFEPDFEILYTLNGIQKSIKISTSCSKIQISDGPIVDLPLVTRSQVKAVLNELGQDSPVSHSRKEQSDASFPYLMPP
jgi:hypothetical protein